MLSVNQGIIHRLMDLTQEMRKVSPSKTCDSLIDHYAGFLAISSSIIQKHGQNGELLNIGLLPIRSLVYQILDIRNWLEANDAVDQSFRILMGLNGQPLDYVDYTREIEHKQVTTHKVYPSPVVTKKKKPRTADTVVRIKVLGCGITQLTHLLRNFRYELIDDSYVYVKRTLPTFHIAARIAEITNKEVEINEH